MKILLLEDNFVDADLTKRGLLYAFPGSQVVVAPTLREGKEILSSGKKFDIGIFDMMLPDGNGMDMLMEIRQKGIDMAVVILTGSGDEEVAVAALRAGANDYVVKKYDYMSALPNVVSYAIANYRKNLLHTSEIIPVLYIEHDANDVELTRRHMKQYAPYIHIGNVSTAEEALTLINDSDSIPFPYKVILMDYRLPGISAMEFIKIIRMERRLMLPIILVTGQGSEDTAVQALKLGANEYLTKNSGYLFRLPSLIVNAFQYNELKIKQEALSESEAKYRLLANNSADVIFVLDMDLNTKYISPAIKTLRGFEPEEAIKQKISDTLTPDSYEKAIKAFSEFLDNYSGNSDKPIPQIVIEVETYKSDGTTVWTEVKASLIKDENNNLIGIQGVSRDISERKHVMDQLILAKNKAEESNRLKSAFLANISHEIRTPLNGIMGFAELLQNTDLSGDEQGMYLKMLKESSDRMLLTISDIVEMSKIEAGEIILNKTRFNLNEEIDLLYSLFKPEAEKKRLSFTLSNHLEKNAIFLLTDKSKVISILTNLLKNAFKYTHSGFVELGAAIRKDQLVFSVTDSGLGIPEDKQESIFQLFVQANLSFSRPYEGIGLGLSIARSYAESMGGTIEVKSEEGKGSTFLFSLPFSVIDTIQGSFPVDSFTDMVTVKGDLMLIVEDDEFNYIYLEETLKRLNMRLLHASDGEDAIRICRENPDIALVLMDIKLPVLNGYEATRQIKEFRSDLPIIAQTAYSQDLDKEMILACGCSDYVIKPFRREELLTKIRKHLP